ncbi:MAG: hypothetical protein QNJ04_10635 [Desulfobacterales bacterium]|nr:hypothetical protein [Desulfobacterales bacterium]
MTLVSFKDAHRYLETGKPPWPPLFLLFGEEVLYKQILGRLLECLLGGASRTVNYEPFDGLNENVLAALAAVNTYSLMAEPKVVALTDARLFVSRRNEERLWQQAFDAVQGGKPAKAARYFGDGLGVRGLEWTDLEGRSDWRKLLGASPGGGDWSWAVSLVRDALENGLKVSTAADPSQALEAAIANGFPESHHLIITTSLVDKRRRLFQAIKAAGVVIDCSVPGGDRKADRAAQAMVMDRTVDDILETFPKQMGPEARRALYALTGFDLRTVATSVEKLANFAGERREIVADDVRRCLERTRRDPLYEFTNAVTDRHLDKSLFYLQSLMDSGDFDHPLPLLAAITNQVRKLIVAKDFTRSPFGMPWHPGCSYPLFQQQVVPAIKAYDEAMGERLAAWQDALAPGEGAAKDRKPSRKAKMASDLPLMARARSPYPVFRTLTKADRFTRQELEAALGAASRADRQLKRGGPGGRLLLEQVIIGICGREPTAGR